MTRMLKLIGVSFAIVIALFVIVVIIAGLSPDTDRPDGNRTSSTANGSQSKGTGSNSTPSSQEENIDSEKAHLQWLENQFHQREQAGQQLVSDPYWSKQAPLIADFISDSEAAYSMWHNRCMQETALGDAKRVALCGTAMSLATVGFEQMVDVLQNDAPMKKESIVDWLNKLPNERQSVRQSVHQRISRSDEQERLYSELEKSNRYEEQSRDLLQRGDYYGSWILLVHSDSIKSNVFAETLSPPPRPGEENRELSTGVARQLR